MSIKVVLFDLDGTLLPMDQDFFLKTYLGMLAEALIPRGYEPKSFLAAMWKSTAAMVQNDGTKTNEKAFWDAFCAIYGEKALDDIPVIEKFYNEDFDKVQQFCGYTPLAAKLIRNLKKAGLRVALATNPLFPKIATEKRIAWAGLSPEDFEFYTTYENECYSKPNLKYYEDLAARLGVSPEECLMVGNDVADDMVAQKLGMQVYLLTDCLINKENTDLSVYPHGSFEELLDFSDTLESDHNSKG